MKLPLALLVCLALLALGAAARAPLAAPADPASAHAEPPRAAIDPAGPAPGDAFDGRQLTCATGRACCARPTRLSWAERARCAGAGALRPPAPDGPPGGE